MFSKFKMNLYEKKMLFYENDYNNMASNNKYFLTGVSQIQIVIYPTILSDSWTSETPGVDSETTQPTQPDTQTPDQTHTNPPEKNSVTSKVGKPDIVPH